MLQSVWQVKLSGRMFYLYRALVMYRELFVRSDFGYHVPSLEEVIAGIKAFFDPAHFCGDVAPTHLRSD